MPPKQQIPPKPLTNAQIKIINEELEYQLKSTKQQLKNYKSLYKTTKSHLQAAKREIESLKLDLLSSDAQEQSPAKRPKNTPNFVSNKPPALPSISGVQISHVQVIKPQQFTLEQMQVIKNQNMKLQDEVQRLKQSKEQLLHEQQELFLQIQENQNLHEKVLQEKKIQTLEHDNEILLKELKKLDTNNYKLKKQITDLKQQNESEFNVVQEEQGGYERIIKDLERQLITSQQNFVAIQEEADFRIENTTKQLINLQSQLQDIQKTPHTTNQVIQKLTFFEEKELITAAKGKDLAQFEQKLLYISPEVLYFLDQNWNENLKQKSIQIFDEDFLAGIFVAGGGHLNEQGKYEINGVKEDDFQELGDE